MGIARRWVFPIIWMVIFAVIGAALVKLAFFADTTDDDAPEFPTGALTEPLATVERGTIRNDVTLSGTVGADPEVPARAEISGEVREVTVSEGQTVKKGQKLAVLRGYNERGGTVNWTLKAPVAGTLSAFDLLVGQQLGIGEEVARVAPPSFQVTATLAPEQQYRLTTLPEDAEVAITGGPAPFTCTGLTIEASASGQDAAASVATVRCAVPEDVRVFAGLAARVTIAGGVADGVLVVPTTAVEGGGGTGIVYLSDGSGEPAEREVTLGISDGSFVEVTDGLAAGDTVLQFVPGALGEDEQLMGRY